MAYIQTIPITVVTIANGTGTNYSAVVSGYIEQITVSIGTLAAGAVDFTITDETTGAPIATISNATDGLTIRPRGATHDTSGAALLYAGGGTAVSDRFPVNGRIKVVTAQAGGVATGTINVMVS